MISYGYARVSTGDQGAHGPPGLLGCSLKALRRRIKDGALAVKTNQLEASRKVHAVFDGLRKAGKRQEERCDGGVLTLGTDPI